MPGARRLRVPRRRTARRERGARRRELIEAYILDFDADIYGSQLRLEFRERLRGERRFESPDALVEQMRRDVERTREIAAAVA